MKFTLIFLIFSVTILANQVSSKSTSVLDDNQLSEINEISDKNEIFRSKRSAEDEDNEDDDDDDENEDDESDEEDNVRAAKPPPLTDADRTRICRLPKHPGKCSRHFPRFFYDHTKKKCQGFDYRG